MHHSLGFSVLALAAAFAGPAQAQQRMAPSRMVPVRGEVRHAGVVNVTTGKWTRPRATQGVPKAGGIQVIYNNTCTWQTQGYYSGAEACEEHYDEGRIPSLSSPAAPFGAAAANAMDNFEIAYCTVAGNVIGVGGYDLDVAFYDNLGGDCVGGIAPTPPPNSSTATAYFALGGLGLPGSTSTGFQACWIVGFDVSNTGWVMASDGDGVFDNDGNVDKFSWMLRQNTWSSPLGYPSATPDGFLLAGEPLSGGFGACSYSIPCGTDILFGNTCGTGLDTSDTVWINVDGIALGDTSGATPPGCPNAISQYGFGTNCYFFGGYPSNPFASYWLKLESERQVPSCGQPNSCGNNHPLGSSMATGTMFLIGSAALWNVTLSGVPAAPNPGILIYGTGGILANPISTAFGNLCISPFFRATSTITPPLSTSGGCGSPSSYSWDFGQYVNTNAFTNGLSSGNSITLQAWYRDPANPGSANLSQVLGSWGLTVVPTPTITSFSPTVGGEGTVLPTVTGTNFGTDPNNVWLLMSGGRGFGNVSSAATTTLSATVDPVGQAGTGGTGMGALTVVRGVSTAVPPNMVVLGPTTSTSTLTRHLRGGVGSNSVASFNLTPASNTAVNAISGAPFPGGLTLDMTGSPGNTLIVRIAFKTAGGEYRIFELRIDFTGVPPNATAKAQHLAQQLVENFGFDGILASSSGTTVRVTMTGSTYGSIVVKGV